MTKRVAIYARVSTTDKGQTTDTQLRVLHEVATRMGWTVVAVHVDHGISGAKGREQRPGYDALLRSITRREIEHVVVYSTCRLSRSLSELVVFLDEIRARDVGIYIHTQGVDTSTPAGRMLFQLVALFGEFEREMCKARVRAGIARARAQGTRLGRPSMPAPQVRAIRAALAAGTGVCATARQTGASASSVSRIAKQMAAEVQPS